MKILLIRHGRTKANETHVYATPEEPILTTEIPRLEALGLSLRDWRRSEVLVSPYRRTVETWEALHLSDTPILLEDLREVSFGNMEGRTYGEALKAFPEEVSAWTEDPFFHSPPGGESLAAAFERVEGVLDTWKNNPKDRIVISHEGWIRLALSSVVGRMEAFFSFSIPNARCVILELGEFSQILGIGLGSEEIFERNKKK